MLTTRLLWSPTARALPTSRLCSRQYSSGTPRGPNHELIQMLTRHMEDEGASESRNDFKVRAYARAIKAISELEYPIRSGAQAQRYKGVGVRIADRIDAFLSGTPYDPPKVAKAPKVPKEPEELPKPRSPTRYKGRHSLEEARKEQIIASLMSIPGLGKLTAKELYVAGCRSVADLNKPEFNAMLRPSQKIVLPYWDHLSRPVTPEQASIVRDFVEQHIPSKYVVSTTGDIRRGAPNAPHISLLIVHPHHSVIIPPSDPPNPHASSSSRAGKTQSTRSKIPSLFTHGPHYLDSTYPFLTDIVGPLEPRGLIATTLSESVHKWTGVIRTPERGSNELWEGRAERVERVKGMKGDFCKLELFYVSQRSAGAASILLTGDSAFNISIRAAAARRGYSLNEFGLWRWQDATGDPRSEFYSEESVREHGGYWDFVEGASEREEDIFDAVGMEWVAPDRRNFEFLDVLARSPGKPGWKKPVAI
ncbi:hypothetical protein HYDPIDRAFT_157267 [Hydnomerulius pinastri MD-312]|uniref:DNA-directed DNA polymerase X domain-containing protein n=1 Tax=Hydnomerulius pinastri MD-312 TaxID=994086 RepID=A0A0C9VWK2_9AGAM|nr:hypothetical protein HYDPIDRAFT_157267 [Hydnomerulius pinastri MD-312]